MNDRTKIDPVDQHAGLRLRLRRVRLGLTLAQVGTVLGVQFQQVQKMETGQTRMTPAKMWKLAEYLDVDPAWFFDGLGPRTGKGRRDLSTELKPLEITEESLKLLQIFAKLSPAKQKSIMGMAVAVGEE